MNPEGLNHTHTLRTCEGIHERGQGPVEHLEERVSAGITCGPTQHRVLQDVWDACTVHGSRPELDTGACEAELSERDKRAGPEGYWQPRVPEEVVGVISGCMKVPSSSFIVL